MQSCLAEENLEGPGRSHHGSDSPLLRQYEQYSPGWRYQSATYQHEPANGRHLTKALGTNKLRQLMTNLGLSIADQPSLRESMDQELPDTKSNGRTQE